MALVVLLLILGLMPLFPGEANVGSWTTLALIGIMTLFMVARVTSGNDQLVAPLKALRAPLLLFGVVLVWIALQGMPYTPDAWHHPLWQIEAEATGEAYEGRISVDPLATYWGGLKLLAYGLVIFVVSLAARSEIVVRRSMAVLVGIIIFYSAVGLAAWLLGVDNFLWLNDGFADTYLSGRQQVALPFDSPGHLATYASMGIIICSGLIMEQVGSFMIGMSSTSHQLKRSLKHLVMDKPLLFIGIFILGAVLLLLQSPAGYVALGAGMFTLVMGALRANILPGRPRLAMMACLACVVLIVGFTFYDGMENAALRGGIGSTETSTTVSAIQASPWLGYGYGSYGAVSKIYAENDASYMVEMTHSAILEMTVGLGIPGVMLLLAALAIVFRIVWRGTRYGRGDKLVPVLACAIGAQMLLHVLLESALQTPTIALCFVLIIGLGLSQAIPAEKR
jgi:hypothetical protein